MVGAASAMAQVLVVAQTEVELVRSACIVIDTDENISPVENPIFAILTKIHL